MDDVATTYAYVDTAFGAVSYRNRPRRLGEINFADEGAERYISHRRASSALLDWVRTHTNDNGNPTIEGFPGEVWDTSLPFDFDNRVDPALALEAVRRFLDRLERHEVPLDALRFYFSGAKGFHVEIPNTLFGGFEPSTELHAYERAAALELMAEIPFDTAVYDKLRLWRLPNTLNAKGQHYKIRLSLEEIRTLSMAEILALAEHPRPKMVTAPDQEWMPNEYLVEVWQRARGLKQRPAGEPVLDAEPVTRAWSDDRSNVIFNAALVTVIAASWPLLDPTVSRHSDFLLPLSGFLARHMEAERVAAVLKDAARYANDTNFLDDRTRHWEEEIDRLASGSVQKIADGQPVEGLPTIGKRWPELAEFLSTHFMARVETGTSANSASKVKGFALTTLLSAMDEPPEQISFLVEGMLPSGGISLWGAKPKVGKSVMVRNLAMCVARGEAFLGRECHKGVVIVLALEEKRAEVINHFRQMGGFDEAIHLHTGAAPGSSKEGLAALANVIVMYQPALVIIDPVFKLVRVKDSSDYAELTRELEPVIELARQSGCHIAVTHHLGKMAREGGDDVLGSTAIFGAVDTLVLMRRMKDQKRTLETIQRYGKDLPETAVPMDEANGMVGLGVAISELKLHEARDRVLEVLGGFAEDYWPDGSKVHEVAGLDRNLVWRMLKELAEEGKIESRGEGKRGSPRQYRLPRNTANTPNTANTANTESENGSIRNPPGEPVSEIEKNRMPYGHIYPIRHTETPKASKGAAPVCMVCGQPTAEHTPDELAYGCKR